MPIPPLPGTDVRRAAGPEPLRRRPVAPGRALAIKRRTINFLLVFATVVLVVDALVGEKGLLQTLKVRRQHQELAASVDALRRENAALRETVNRLNDDPSTIESVARQELGLIRPGEVLFIIKNAAPANVAQSPR